MIEDHVKTALEAAQKAGISGKEITPYLLKYIADHSSGESLEANIALIENNASLAAREAVDMCKIKKHKL